ncbi:MAG: 30S ribosome-binding factor RbfA [Gammaproteobacteria bacterium]|nr:30S ribosome-binding factor RbfA [Gammaproteobacteria bacterium]
MRPFGRELRVADHIRERLAEIIRAEMRDPRVGMVSINDAKVSKDLSNADIYVSALSADTPQRREELITVLNKAAGFLRTCLARESLLRITPSIRFHYDDVWVRGSQLDSLIEHAVAADREQHDKQAD